ncbi:MAG: hypothetical protein ACRDU5_12525 [Mycobacterium sp.]
MQTTLRYLTPLIAAAGVAAAIAAAPAAGAQPNDPTLPQCTDTGGSEALGGSTTECVSPGNVSIDATPAEPEFDGPWGDMYGGPGFFFP